MAEFDTVVATDQLTVSPVFHPVQDLPKCSLESLMEKLKNKASKDPKHYKSWAEMTKALRVAVTDKRNLMDHVDRTNLQKILDTLQKSIKVTSLQSMLERLDSITRQQGLKLVRQSNTECYITSDMYYVEILLEHSGEVNDVKIAHDKPVSCPELTKVLRSGNFTEFTKHLEGLSAIYQLNTDSSGQLDCEAQKKLKKKAYCALHHLEYDLSQLWQLQRSIKDPSNLVHKSPVGILQERQGGYSLKLTYFISPYDLLDMKTKSSITLTVDAVVEKGLGHSVTVCIESSNTHKLQTAPLITVPKNGEKSLPSFAAHTHLNSTTLPASFTLKLQEPIPIAVSILKKIEGVTKISNFADLCNSQSLLSVVINNTSKGKIQSASMKNLYVTLPDQHHCYNMKSNADLQGVLVSLIPFTHPTHVPQILDFLRQQMLFNTVISSCVRPGSKKDVESALKFDIHSYSTNHIQVTFVHPLDESLAAVDLDLKEITSVKCKIHTLGIEDSLCSDEYASKIMQRCLSIPVTMRAVIRKAHGQQQLKKPDRSDLYSATVGSRNDSTYIPHMPSYGTGLSNGSSLSSGPFTNLASGMCNKSMDATDMTNSLSSISSDSNIIAYSDVSLESSLNSSIETQDIPGKKEEEKNVTECQSPSLASPLASVQSKPANTMLLSMLNDVPSATPSSSSSFPMSSKPRKRKATSDAKSISSIGRSPKRKMSENDSVREQSTLDAMSLDSPSMASEKCNSLPASLPSSTTEAPQTIRAPSSVDPYVKSESHMHGYPQRSSSTDSYLSFHPHQVTSNSESSNPELPAPISQGKIRSQFSFDKQHQSTECSVSLDLENTLKSLPLQISVIDKSDEKSLKKLKKTKDGLDSKLDLHEVVISKVHDQDSESSSSSDMFSKSGTDSENRQPEEQIPGIKVPHFGNPLHSSIGGTSLKISKTGDGHKVSKSDVKIKQKDGRKSTSESISSKKKGDSKKERKRKQFQNPDGTSNRPSHPDSSLMPPPSSSSSVDNAQLCDAQPKRPMSLNVKDSPPMASKPSTSVNAIISGSLHNPTKNSSKSTSDRTGLKTSRSSHSSSSSKSEHDGDISSVTKVTINSSMKLQNKVKQSTSGKTVSSSSHSAGQSSPSKPKSASLKLKNALSPSLHLSSSVSAVISKSPSQVHSSGASISIVSTLIEEPTSPNSKQAALKSQLKSQMRKGCLSAVIDKLRVSATHAQLPDNFKPNSCGTRTDSSVDKSELKSDRKDSTKEQKDGNLSKTVESKNKKCSDQFTVKQSSQGIKLTVTKTKSIGGSLKHGKPKLTSSKTVSGSTQSVNKNKISGLNIQKKTSSLTSTSVKKTNINVQTSTSAKTQPSVSSSSTSPKAPISSATKVSSSVSSSYQKISSSTGSVQKPKTSPNLQKKKLPFLSEPKNIAHVDSVEKSSVSSNESTKSVSASSTRLTRMDSNWQLSNISSRSEEDLERERTIRLLLEQSKNEGQNGSELVPPALDFALKALALTKTPELDDKEYSVSSSSDVKRQMSTLRVAQEQLCTLEQNIGKAVHKDNISSKKHDTINTDLVSSSEVSVIPFSKLYQQSERLNTHMEEDSSPEDGLVIDNPGTPIGLSDHKRSYHIKKEKSPEQKKAKNETVLVDERSDKFDYSQSSFIAKTPDQIFITATNHSPSMNHELSSIDDELLNMALTMDK